MTRPTAHPILAVLALALTMTALGQSNTDNDLRYPTARDALCAPFLASMIVSSITERSPDGLTFLVDDQALNACIAYEITDTPDLCIFDECYGPRTAEEVLTILVGDLAMIDDLYPGPRDFAEGEEIDAPTDGTGTPLGEPIVAIYIWDETGGAVTVVTKPNTSEGTTLLATVHPFPEAAGVTSEQSTGGTNAQPGQPTRCDGGDRAIEELRTPTARFIDPAPYVLHLDRQTLPACSALLYLMPDAIPAVEQHMTDLDTYVAREGGTLDIVPIYPGEGADIAPWDAMGGPVLLRVSYASGTRVIFVYATYSNRVTGEQGVLITAHLF